MKTITQKSLILILSILCFVNIATAKNFYVDPVSGLDTNDGLSWDTAVQTISKATTLAAANSGVDDILIKGGSDIAYTINFASGVSTSTFGITDNYYGSCKGDETSPSQRPLTDRDGNGIIESWEFQYPTTLSSTYSGGTAFTIGTPYQFNGFTITHTGTSTSTAIARTVAISSNLGVFANNIITGCNLNVSGTVGTNTYGILFKALGRVQNCLIEKNQITVGITVNISCYPIMEVAASGTSTIGTKILNSIIRNNKVTLDYSGCITPSTANSSAKGLMMNITAGTSAMGYTVVNNCLIHNNEMTYIPHATNTTATLTNGAPLYIAGAASATDSIVNCTVANNKGTKIYNAGINIANNATGSNFILNNVFWNNQNDPGTGAVASNIYSNSPTNSTSGTNLLSYNFSNAGSSLTNNVTTIIANDNTLGTSGKLPNFQTPSSTIGNNITESTYWTLTSGSYLSGKGATISASNSYYNKDKDGNNFASGTSRSVGAYELISKTAQTITFNSLSAKTYGDGSFTVSATGGSSGYAATFTSSDPTVATCSGINGATVNILKAGTCKIYANQPGNGTYSAASQTEQSLTVNKKTLTITGVSADSKTYDGNTATTLSGTPMLSGVIAADVANVILGGTYAANFTQTTVGSPITVNVSGYSISGSASGNYTLTQPTLSADINKAPQTITFGALPTGKIVGDADFPAGATSTTSGVNAITYISSNTGAATIDGGLIHLVGAGTTTITASQASSTNYNAASSVGQSLTVNVTSVSVSSNSNISFYSATSVTDVTVSAGFELTVNQISTVKSITVNPGGKLTLAANLNVVGALTIQSDANSTATIIDNGGTLTAGTVDVQRYLKGGRNWYISSPISTATANVFNIASSKNLLYNYSESTATNNPWPQISTGSTALNVMQGYVVKLNADTTVNFTGTLNTGDQTVSFNRTTGQSKEGFNLLGNPYVSFVNIKDIQTSDTVHLESSYWLRSKNAGSTAYAFDTYNLKSGVGITLSGLKLTKYIPPMQAFWVRVKKGFSSGSLTLHNSLRAHQDSVNNIFRAPASIELTQQTLRLQVSNGVNTDETVLYTNSGASNGFDDYDSPKMSNGSTSIPEIYTLAGSEQLAINGLNSIPYETEMPLGFSTIISGTYSLKASQISNFAQGTQIILKDYQDLNNPVISDLSDGRSYSFSSVATSNNTKRFTLIFRAPSVTTRVNPTNNGNVWLSTNTNGQIIINGIPNGETSVAVYNAIGRIITTITSNSSTFEIPVNVPGIYLVHIQSGTKSWMKRLIIN